VRFLGHSHRPPVTPYVLYPPYEEARAKLLARRPSRWGQAGEPFGRLFGVVLDIGLDDYMVSIYLFDDGTISIYSTGGIHSTGLAGAPRVADAAVAIFEEVEANLGELSPVEDIATLPVPDRGHSQILVRTYTGDLAAFDQPEAWHRSMATIAAMALLLTQLARAAVAEGFDRVEPGEVRYQLAPEIRRIRSTLLDWQPSPDQIAPGARVASMSVEIGEAGAVTSLFALADGSISVYRSDGTVAESLGGTPGMAETARGLLDSVGTALEAFGPAALLPLPQPGRVQFVTRARPSEHGEWTELRAVVNRETLEEGSHPLSATFARANEVLRIAG
jgi:hypothetical protein